MVRKPERHLITACLATLVAAGLAASCTEGEGLPATTGDDAPSNTITTPQTRAAVTGADDMDAFSVWAWKDGGGKVFPVDDALLVENTGSGWEYDPRYLTRWEEGSTYDFYALYPSVEATDKGYESASCDPNGTLTVTGFDCTKGVDLMSAAVTDRSGAQGGAVAFTFGHMLAKVSVAGQSEGSNAYITSIKLTGAGIAGDYNSNNSNPWTTTGNGSDLSLATDISLPSTPTDIAGELLLIPQEVDGIGLSITYQYPGVDNSSKTVSYNLPTSTVPLWEAGKSYRYTFTLMGNYIIFDKPTVQAWDDATGGIIVVE